MSDPTNLLNRASAETARLCSELTELAEPFDAWCRACAECWDAGGKLLVCGNGGSAADSMHLAEELVARFCLDRPALAAISLTDPTVLTCAGNDFGFERIFSRQVEALGRPGDVLVVLSTSGNSPNLIAAVDAAEQLGMKVVALLGKGGGKLKGRCDVELLVDDDTSHRVQEMHKVLYHTLCEWADGYAVERAAGPKPG
ncbi:MAG: SIS domain-containing protein [Planctomycetota bacterium]